MSSKPSKFQHKTRTTRTPLEFAVAGHISLTLKDISGSRVDRTHGSASSNVGLRCVLLMLQHWVHSRPRTRKREKSSLYFGCDFSGWYNFGKIIKTVTVRCHISKLKCTKFDFGCGSAPRPRRGSLQRSPRPPSWILGGLVLRGRKGGEG